MTIKFCDKCKQVTYFDGILNFCQYCGNSLVGAEELPEDYEARTAIIENLKKGIKFDTNGQVKLL